MKTSIAAIVLGLLATPAFAQQAPPAAQPTPTVAGFVRNAFNGSRNNILRSAEKMPEEFYGLRPGTQEEVRTFGQHVAHVATFNFLWCSQAKGEKNPNAGNQLEKTLKTKAEIVKAVTDAFAYCEPVYAGINDQNGAEVVDITQENGNRVRQARLALLTLNVIHNNEVYGSMVTTLRIKNIVPSSSEPRTPPAPAPQR